MNLTRIAFAVVVFASFAGNEAFPQNVMLFDPADLHHVRIDNVSQADWLYFYSIGLDIDNVSAKRDTVWAYVFSDRLESLRKKGYEPEVLANPGPAARAGYPTLQEIGNELLALELAHPTLCKRHNIGSSYQGRELWFMQISDNVGVEEDEPEFKYISTMHGNEIVGVVMCMNLINLLLDDYGSDPQITNLVNELEIWIMPVMNPDGYNSGTRYNAQGYDLNRNFPCRIQDPVNTPDGRPTEIQVVMRWAFKHSSVLSANFHTGALLVNYPYDSHVNPNASYSAAPDDALLIQQSLAYSVHNLPMYNGSYPQGISNGAAWYVIYGGMQDWNYHWLGCNEVTIELSNSHNVPSSQLPTYWSNNRDSMLSYMEECLKGIRGVVTNSITGQPVAATVRAVGIDHDVYTDPDVGDYHRMLLQGTYDLEFSAPGFQDKTKQNIFTFGTLATRRDVTLDPLYDLLIYPATLSADEGGTSELTLMAGTGNAWRKYLILGSMSGTSPGFTLPGGLVLPLNWDAFTDVIINLLGLPPFQNFTGLLDSSGNAIVDLTLPVLPSILVGTEMDFVFLLNHPFDYVSDSATLEILP